MRAAFLGTPAAAVPSLAALLDVADVPLVVTRPDRPRGRSGRPVPSAVKTAAAEWGLALAQPETHAELLDIIDGANVDIGVVVAYGRILKPELLEIPRLGFVNVHFSLLPRWRGAAPVERAMLAGDEVTGVSLMWLDEGMDTGPIISAVETPIADDETGGSLTSRLSYLGSTVLAETLPNFAAGALQPADQMHTAATHAAPLRSDEGRLGPEMSAVEMHRRVRAMWPRPGAWISVDGARIKILRTSVLETPVSTTAGTIVALDGTPVLVTSDGALGIEELQPPGNRPLSGVAWMNGRRGAPAQVDS